jgi:hypothetical protein
LSSYKVPCDPSRSSSSQLYVTNSQQVTSFYKLQVDLGTPDQQLLVLSGIVTQGLRVNDDDNIYCHEFIVHQKVFAKSLVQANVQVGLASTHDDSAFVFAVDHAQAYLDPGTGELLLDVHCVLMGSYTELTRFSYQMVAVLETVVGTITGKITWTSDVWDPPSLDPSTVGAQMGIVANQYLYIPAPPSPPAPYPGFGTTQLTPLVNGYVTSVIRDNHSYVASYEIDNVALGPQLQVTLALGGSFGRATARFAWAGPTQFTLTVSTPSQGNEDFVIQRGTQ